LIKINLTFRRKSGKDLTDSTVSVEIIIHGVEAIPIFIGDLAVVLGTV
jgi:hypothetical protein